MRSLSRVDRFEDTGHAGDTASVGGGVSELRIHVGPGYRVYYVVLSSTVVLLAGDKSTQAKDIRKAKEFAAYWRGQKL